MIPIVCPIELKNSGGSKIKVTLDETNEIMKFNAKNDDFPIFHVYMPDNNLGPGDTKYIIASFRPLTNKSYRVTLPISHKDEINQSAGESKITLSGVGYHPLTTKLPAYRSLFENMPHFRMDNKYNDHEIQKCGISLEEIDFGYMSDKPVLKTFIIYNYSLDQNLEFEFFNPGFNMNDEIHFEPNSATLEPNSHLMIKVVLYPKSALSNYEGEVEIKITWNSGGDNNRKIEKENLYIRILKKSLIKDVKHNISYILYILHINFNRCLAKSNKLQILITAL